MPGMCETSRRQLLTSCGRHRKDVRKPTDEWVPACHEPGFQLLSRPCRHFVKFALFVLTVAAAESAIGLALLVIYYRVRGTIKLYAMLVKRFVRSGRPVPLPADERSNKPADSEEAQSWRGLDDSCLSNIIVLHRWLVPARHNRLLHRCS